MTLIHLWDMGPGSTDPVVSSSDGGENDIGSSSKREPSPATLDDDIDLTSIFDEDRQETLSQMDANNNKEGSTSSALEKLWPSPPEEKESVWQNDRHDMPHRREIIREVAKLLKERKTNPSSKWMKELPYKARKLEEQLYKSAPSLEAYVDKATLKQRLKRVAKAITSQFRIAKRSSSKSSRVSSSSSRSSVTSISSSRSSIASIGSVSMDGGMGPVPLSASSTSPPQSAPSSVPPAASLSTNQPPDSLDDLQKKQALNQKLQQEILENIRQQQQIMRDLLNQQDPSKPNVEAKKKADINTSTGSGNMALQNLPFNKGSSSSSIKPAAQMTPSLPTPMKSPSSFNHKELMAAAQSGLQNAILNNTNNLQRRISAPSTQQLMAAQQALMNNPNIPNNPNNMAGLQAGLQRSQSAPPMSQAMMAAATAAAAMQTNSNNMGMSAENAAMMAAASLGGAGPMNPAAAGGMNMPNNLNVMAGTMMQQQQQVALLQQQQQQLQQQLAMQQKNNPLQQMSDNRGSLGGGTNFHPTMPPPNNLMASSMRSSITGPSPQQQMAMSPNASVPGASASAASPASDDFNLSPSTFKW